METNTPVGEVGLAGAGGVSPAADFAGDGIARASKLSNTIKVLRAFGDTQPPRFVTNIQTPDMMLIKLMQRLPAPSALRNKNGPKVTNVFVKCEHTKVPPYSSTEFGM
jgi:hypothetical protein